MNVEPFVCYGFAIKSDTVRLYHGTDEESANSIAENGVSLEGMAKVVGRSAHSFCMTVDLRIGSQYADVNPARGKPALLGFDLPKDLLEEFLRKNPAWMERLVFDRGYEVLRDAFPTMNYAMTNVSVDDPINLSQVFYEQ